MSWLGPVGVPWLKSGVSDDAVSLDAGGCFVRTATTGCRTIVGVNDVRGRQSQGRA